MVRVTPLSARVPVPRVAGQFSAQAISQRLEPYRQHCLNVWRGELQISQAFVVTVNPRSQGVRRNKAIRRMIRCEVDSNNRTLQTLIMAPC